MTFCVDTRRKELTQALPRRFKSRSATLRVTTTMTSKLGIAIALAEGVQQAAIAYSGHSYMKSIYQPRLILE